DPTASSLLGEYPRMLAEVSTTGRPLRGDELEALRELGERAADSGQGLRQLVGLYLSETRRLWGTLPGVARAGSAGERARIGDAVLGAVDAAVAALGDGHERAQRLVLRQ